MTPEEKKAYQRRWMAIDRLSLEMQECIDECRLEGEELRSYIRGFLRDAYRDGTLKEIAK